MSSETMHQIVELVESAAHERPSPIKFEMAYQARSASDRIRFAIKHTEQFCPRPDKVRDAGLQLLDALERLETVDRRVQGRTRKEPETLRAGTERAYGAVNGAGTEVFS